MTETTTGRPLSAVPDIDDRWTIQIFATEHPLGFALAHSALDLALIGERHHSQESSDGQRHFLIVETRDDPTVLRSVRLALETAVPGSSLENVHAPRASEPRSDDDQAA